MSAEAASRYRYDRMIELVTKSQKYVSAVFNSENKELNTVLAQSYLYAAVNCLSPAEISAVVDGFTPEIQEEMTSLANFVEETKKRSEQLSQDTNATKPEPTVTGIEDNIITVKFN